MNIFWKDKYANGRNELIEGLRFLLPKLTESWVVTRISEISASDPDVALFLYESGRCAIAYAFSNPIVDPDDVADLRRLTRDVEVVKAAAEFLIRTELGVPTSIFG